MVDDPGPDICQEQFEILVENGLWSDAESNRFHSLPMQWNIQIDMLPGNEFREKSPLPVHVGGIQPDGRMFRKEREEADAFLFHTAASYQVGIDFRHIHLFDRQLGIAVKCIDFLHFVAEEGKPVRIIQGIGEMSMTAPRIAN